MRKLLSALTLLAFVIIMQMPFIHALDMRMESLVQEMNPAHMSEHGGALCNTDETASTNSCFSEIPESKWIENVKKIESIVLIISLCTFFLVLAATITRGLSDTFFRRRIFYPGTLYLGLYGIVRNVN